MERQELGIKLEFHGKGVDERGIVAEVLGNKAPAVQAGDVVVRVDPRYFRPAEVDSLKGDATRAQRELGWEPEITARQMCAEMIEEDLKVAQRKVFLRQHGHDVSVTVEN